MIAWWSVLRFIVSFASGVGFVLIASIAIFQHVEKQGVLVLVQRFIR